MSEYISGGELFDTIRKFPYKLVQLYVAEIAVALGIDSISLDDFYIVKITRTHFRLKLPIDQYIYIYSNNSRLPAQRRCHLS